MKEANETKPPSMFDVFFGRIQDEIQYLEKVREKAEAEKDLAAMAEITSCIAHLKLRIAKDVTHLAQTSVAMRPAPAQGRVVVEKEQNSPG